MRTVEWLFKTIGIVAAYHELFYITMRALEDVDACTLRDLGDRDIYDGIEYNYDFQERIVDSWQYRRLIERLETRLAGKEEPEYDDDDLFEDECDDMDQYDTIIE